MFGKWILLFEIINCYFYVSHGLSNEIQKTTYSKIIAREHMFMGDSFEISIIDFQIPEELEKQPPLMMISVMIDKSLGYNFSPIFPYLREIKPVLDLNAVNNEQVILSPSTAAFKLDFGTESFTAIPHSSNVNLYTSGSNIGTDDNMLLNQTSVIRMTSLKSNGSLHYNLSFTLFVDSKDLEGNYKLDLHFFEDSSMTIKFKGSMNLNNRTTLWFILIAFLFTFISFIVQIVIITRIRYLSHLLLLLLTFGCWWLTKLFESENFLTCNEHEVQFGSITDFCIFQTSTEIIGLGATMVAGVMLWILAKNTGLGYKIDKVFHVFVYSSMMVHIILQSYNYKSDALTYSHLTKRICETSFISERTANRDSTVQLTIFLNMLMINAIEMTDTDWKKYLGTKGYRTIFWRCYNAIPSFLILSDIVLPIMILLGIPFHLRWIEGAVLSIAQLLGWKMMIAIQCKNNAPQAQEYLKIRYSPGATEDPVSMKRFLEC